MGTTEQGAISPDPYWWEAAPLRRVDEQRPREGASSRNSGITSGTPRPSVAATTKSFGEKRAKGTLAESKAAREDLWWYGG
jgi:hypothetical protein